MADTERSRRRRDSHRYRKYRAKIQRELGNVCHICGGPIPEEARWPHPLSWTLHHQHAIAQGGELRANGVPAHKRCNEQLGDGRRRRRNLNTPDRPSDRW